MAKAKGKKITWTASPDTDVVSYTVYCVPTSQNLGYDSPSVSVPATTLEYVLPGIFNMAIAGDYSLGVSAVDGAGNESDMVTITSFFDFSIPSPISNLRVVDL